MEKVVKYIQDAFGMDAKVSVLDTVQNLKLPLYLKGNFELYSGQLSGRHLIWAKVGEYENVKPSQLQKQAQLLQGFLAFPVIFVFDRLEGWLRKRLIAKHVAFVQPFKQLYIPSMLLQLSDVVGEEKANDAVGKLSPLAQCAVLYHLQKKSLEHQPFKQIAHELRYSAMTVSRIMKELRVHDLLRISGGKEKSIEFNLQGKSLWEKVLPFLTTPVRETWCTDELPDNPQIFIAGDTALAAISMLSESNEKTFAVAKDVFRTIKNSFKKLDRKYGDYKLEVWNYNPQLLSVGEAVDKLSLYLSLQTQEDERVMSALTKVLNEMEW